MNPPDRIPPGPHFVYLHLDADGAVVYVGVTACLAKRTARHKFASPWWSEVAAVEVESTHESYYRARVREAQLIRELAPKHNKHGGFLEKWQSLAMNEGLTEAEIDARRRAAVEAMTLQVEPESAGAA